MHAMMIIMNAHMTKEKEEEEEENKLKFCRQMMCNKRKSMYTRKKREKEKFDVVVVLSQIAQTLKEKVRKFNLNLNLIQA